MIKCWQIPRTKKALDVAFLDPLGGDWGFILVDFEIDFLFRGDYSPSARISLILMNVNVLVLHLHDTRTEEER